MKRYLENKKSDLQHVNLPFLSAIKKQLSPEKEEGRHVTQLQFRFIALQYVGQKSSKFSPKPRVRKLVP